MSPRGIAIPDVEEFLFDAAERVLRRDGPEGLSSRAITAEARLAKGLLYRHFADLNAFLAAFVVDRATRAAAAIGGLPERAGTRTVAENLVDAALFFASEASALIDLVHGRPSLAVLLAQADQPHAGGLRNFEEAFATYLETERETGRIATDADTRAFATALVATVHQLAITHGASTELDHHVRRVVSALVSRLTRQ